jgi:tRNA threonylcarbamoyladenosine biosynthesis protein TsaE
LAHYDFYRLEEAGIMANELSEVIGEPQTVTVIEWGGVVDGVLPKDRLTINITSPRETSRQVTVSNSGPSSQMLEKRIS